MQQRIKAYYRGERITNMMFAGFGAMAASISSIIYFIKPGPLSLGFLVGLALVGTGEIIIGLRRFLLSFQHYKKANENWEHADKSYLSKFELQRMERRDGKIQSMRRLLLGLFFFSFISIVIMAIMKSSLFFIACWASITFHMAIILVFDLINQYRIQEYAHQLKKNLH